MYRQYENARVLEVLLRKRKREYQEYKMLNWLGEITDDDLYEKYLELKELEDRIKFAYDDEVNG